MQAKEAENIYAKAAHFIHCAPQGAPMPKHKHKPRRAVRTAEGHQVVKFRWRNSHFSLFLPHTLPARVVQEKFLFLHKFATGNFLSKKTPTAFALKTVAGNVT